jgi:hypothetical protein
METVVPQLYPFMEMVAAEIEADEANILQQPNSYLSPFMETVRFEVELPRGKLEAVRTKNQRLHIELGNSEVKKNFLGKKCRSCDRNLRLSAPIAIGVKLSGLKAKITSALEKMEN